MGRKRKNVVSVNYKYTKVYYEDKKADYDYKVPSSTFLIGVIIYIIIPILFIVGSIVSIL